MQHGGSALHDSLSGVQEVEVEVEVVVVVVVTQLLVTEEQVMEPQRLLVIPQKVLHCSVHSLPAQRLAHSVLAL